MGLPEAERIPLGPTGSYLTALKEHDGGESPALRRVRARLDYWPTLRDVILEWLHRTPIQGSTPSQPDDDARVRSFCEGYLAAHARAVERGLELARAQRLGGSRHAQARRARAARGRVGPSVPARGRRTRGDPPARSRIRAALVFIESYRELPLLAWPREVIDSIMTFEQSFVIPATPRPDGRAESAAAQERAARQAWTTSTRPRSRTASSARCGPADLLVRAGDLPPLEQPEIYGFARGVEGELRRWCAAGSPPSRS